MRRVSSRNAEKQAAAAQAAGGSPTAAGGELEAHGGAGLGSSLLSTMNVSPFLFKTWNLVSDPTTDHIVSWAPDGLTFVVHKPDAMEREILPHVFKHSNFASFLNNYGFRKCHTDRYEFGVPGFQRGNPELLKSLKRHDAQRGTNMKKSSGSGGGAVQRPASARVGNVEGLSGLASTQTASPPPVHVMELGVYGGMQSEVDQLKRDRLLLLQEVMRLREAQTTTTTEVRHLQQRLQQAETVQAQVLTFLQQHISPTLLQANSHYLMPGRKRRHLLMPPSPGRDGDVATAGTADGIMAEPPGSAAQSLELLELPNDPLATELVNGDGEGVDSILGDAHGSYLNRGANSLALSLAPPASTLYGSTTGVFMVSQPSPATPPSLESLELSDALYSAQQSMLPPAQPSDLAFPLSFSQPPSPTPLSRMASGDIETILKEISLDPTEQLPTMEPIKV